MTSNKGLEYQENKPEEQEVTAGERNESNYMQRFVESNLYPQEKQRFAALKIALYVLAFLVFAILIVGGMVLTKRGRNILE